MRRSQAPSLRKAASEGKAMTTNGFDASMPMQWGSVAGYHGFGPRDYAADENPLLDKRIFRVLWRNPSTRKHKIWNGDGTLEFTAIDGATLKDDTGTVMGTISVMRLRPEKLQESAQLEIGGKEVELQEELKTVEECVALRKQEIACWCNKVDQHDSEEHRKPKGGFVLRMSANFSRPQKPYMLKAPKRGAIAAAMPSTAACSYKQTEYMCMLQPSELQMQSLRTCAAHAAAEQTMHSAGIIVMARQICDHPVLLKNNANQQSQLMQLLREQLPPWQDLEIQHSAKFECLYLLLNELVLTRGEKCAIVAEEASSLQVIQGYCQYEQINYIYLDDDDQDGEQAASFNADATEDEQAPLVAFICINRLPAVRLTRCQFLIFYNYVGQAAAARRLLAPTQDTTIYTLITADSLEEHCLQQRLKLVPDMQSALALLSWPVRPTHELLEGRTDFKHWKPPYSAEFLKAAHLDEELQNLCSVFTRQNGRA